MKHGKWAALVAALALTACVLSGCQSSSTGEVASEDLPDMTDQVNDSAEPEFILDTDPFYVLVMGLDTREGTVEEGAVKSRSDTMMLVRVDPNTYEIGLLSIPRDTYAWVGDKDNRINEAYYLSGPEGAIEQVELLTGIKADYYLSTTFVGFNELVDGLGGVDANVPIDMSLKDVVHGGTIDLYAGEQHLDGASALVLARVRKAYSWDGDTYRQTNSRSMVETMIRGVAGNPDAAVTSADLLFSKCDTNMDREQFDGLVQLFCEHADEISFVDGTTPYANGMDDAIGLWVVWRDEETSHACAEAVDKHEDPQAIVPLPTGY